MLQQQKTELMKPPRSDLASEILSQSALPPPIQILTVTLAMATSRRDQLNKSRETAINSSRELSHAVLAQSKLMSTDWDLFCFNALAQASFLKEATVDHISQATIKSLRNHEASALSTLPC
ncbi:MAG TPA: hypothetical protein VM532_15810 [Burkholderiales bacterium]|nr:hypothetical protein [Burkholderiales bacterium]